MKSLTVRLPDTLVAQIETESRQRKLSKSDVVRERLVRGNSASGKLGAGFETISDLIGSIDGLPADLSERKKAYLNASGYGLKRHR
jgi:Arc/MetJ-type ribon-helix-helix transcriptional regulator